LEGQRRALLQGLQGAPAPIETRPKQPAKKIPAPSPQRKTIQSASVCVFADVHGNFPALEKVVKEAKSLGAENFLFLGDVVSYGPFPHECIEFLANMRNIVFLRGNHDQTAGTGIPENGSNRIAREMDLWTHQCLSQTEREWLLTLPLEYREDNWLAVHGAPLDPQRFYAYVYEMTYKDNLSYLDRERLSVCFYGHTHVQFMYRRLASGGHEKLPPERIKVFQTGERLLLNPGSVGQPRDGDPRAAFALWERSTGVVRFYRIQYPVARTVRAVKQEGLPEDLIYRLEVGR
jgi:diadenosine tetraphosphatase ApaH/serine/threonine PP2A family protein phosphatase